MPGPEFLESGRRAVPVRSHPVAVNARAGAPRMGGFKLNRRSFLVKTVLGTAATMIAGRRSGGVLGANDVFVEKPVSHNVSEGRQMVEAARRYGRMVQAGTQARAHPELIAAVVRVHAGNLGRIRYARGTCYKPRMSIGKAGTGVVPPGLDYDLWTGPAPFQPLTRERPHYD